MWLPVITKHSLKEVEAALLSRHLKDLGRMPVIDTDMCDEALAVISTTYRDGTVKHGDDFCTVFILIANEWVESVSVMTTRHTYFRRENEIKIMFWCSNNIPVRLHYIKYKGVWVIYSHFTVFKSILRKLLFKEP